MAEKTMNQEEWLKKLNDDDLLSEVRRRELLQQVSHVDFLKELRRRERHHQLSITALAILELLDLHGPLRPTDLLRELPCSGGNLTALMRTLMRHGLVRIEQRDNNWRDKWIVPT